MLWCGCRITIQHSRIRCRCTQFDPKLAARATPLSREQFAQIAAKFRAQDEARAKALAEKDELLAARDAEIADLQAKIAAAQADAKPDDRDYTESDTRDRFIDQLLLGGLATRPGPRS